MLKLTFPRNFELVVYVAKWLLLATLVAGLAGTASAGFLFALDWATATRSTYRWYLWLLPIAGFVIGWFYLRFGREVEAGNNLLLEQIHDPKKVVPLRMVPLVLCGTVASHLFGASVGREGTAVQMGGALADQLTHIFKLQHEDRRIILMCGIAAGFSSVFGTPLGGAIFGLEVLAIGRLRHDAILPCLIAAVIADQVGLLWGVHHMHYSIPLIPSISAWSIAAMLIAGAAFGLVGRGFSAATHWLSAQMKRHIRYGPLRPFVGGLAIATAVWFLGADRYIGLGLPVIAEALQGPVPVYDFLAKMVFTIASLGSGFKGGEVTPLFYIGATLGNALAPLLNMPVAFLAAIGFVAVFAGGANTPIASTLIAIELFGAEVGIFAALACAVSYLFSGHAGIYLSQRAGQAKHRLLWEDDQHKSRPARTEQDDAPAEHHR